MYLVVVCKFGKYRIQIVLSDIEVLFAFLCSRIDSRLRNNQVLAFGSSTDSSPTRKSENA
jgi:hypothetical protein